VLAGVLGRLLSGGELHVVGASSVHMPLYFELLLLILSHRADVGRTRDGR
jgi:hypothetical protein